MKIDRRDALRTLIGSSLVALPGGPPPQVDEAEGLKAMVRAFAAAVSLRDSVAMARYVKGAAHPEAIARVFSSDLVTLPDFDVTEVVAEIQAETATAAVTYSLNAPAMGADLRSSRLLQMTEVLKLEKQRTTWVCLPDQDLMTGIARLDETPHGLLLALARPLNGAAVLISRSRELSPLVETWKDQSRANSCVSNIRQLGLAAIMYAQDHDNRYPPANSSFADLWDPYTKNRLLYTCPMDVEGALSYTFNTNLCGMPAHRLEDPGRTVLIYEGTNGQLACRHAGKSAVVFADGRAEMITKKEADALYW